MSKSQSFVPLRLSVIVPFLALGLGCQEPGAPVSRPDIDESGGLLAIGGAETPSAEIVAPLGQGFDEFATVPGQFHIRWQGLTASDGSPIVGYQLKLIEIPHVFVQEEQVIEMITNPLLRVPNLLIPDEFAVDAELDGPLPPLLSLDYFYRWGWWPRLYPETVMSFVLPDGAYAFAVRTIDEENRITAPALFNLASEEESGNVLKLDVSPNIPVNPHILLSLGDLYSFQGTVPFEEFTVDWPAMDLDVSWEIDADWYGGFAGPVRYRFDCEGCEPGGGVGEWTGWGAWEAASFEIPPAALGTVATFRIEARDESFAEDRQAAITVNLNVLNATLDKPALLIDDFRMSGINDCEHDAIVQPMVLHAVTPHLDGGELDFFNAYQTFGDCGEVAAAVVPGLDILLRYRTVFWNVASAGQPSALAQVTPNPRGFPTNTEQFLALYVLSGGNLVVWGLNNIGELLGGFFPGTSYDPPPLPDPNFGPGTFVWDLMRLRVQFDRVARGTSRVLHPTCSGLVALELSEVGAAMGFPAGSADPTGYDPSRTAIWLDSWSGYRNPSGAIGMNAPTGVLPFSDPLVETWYTVIPNSFAWEDDPVEACGAPFGSPFDGEPLVTGIAPEGSGGKIVWIGTQLFPFNQDHEQDLKDLMRGAADWVYE